MSKLLKIDVITVKLLLTVLAIPNRVPIIRVSYFVCWQIQLCFFAA